MKYLKSYKIFESKTKNKKTQYDVAYEVRIWIDECKLENKQIELRDIVTKTMEVMRTNKMLCHNRQVANIVQDALWAWSPDYQTNKIISMI